MSNEPLDLAKIIRDHESKHFCPDLVRRTRGVWDPIVWGECLPYRLATLAQEQAAALDLAKQTRVMQQANPGYDDWEIPSIIDGRW
jgi:hypothetical protein